MDQFIYRTSTTGFKLYDGHDRSFFFFAYEPRWRQDFVTTTTLFPTEAEKAGDFRNLVRTTSGWVPTNIAAQFGLASNGPSAIYQQFTLNNGRLVPIVLPAVAGSVSLARLRPRAWCWLMVNRSARKHAGR